MPGMVTTIRRHAKPHLYIDEWMAAKDLNNTQVANRIGVARETVFRWRREQHRLTPDKLAQLASALNIEPSQLWQLPPPKGRADLNAIAKDLDDDQREAIELMVRRLAQKH
jgi:transcriptional regulator with XRE-family HTH domain